MYNPEKLATLGKQGKEKPKTKTQHNICSHHIVMLRLDNIVMLR
jgi:hypothetical protein